MTENNGQSQSKGVVLLSSLFLAGLSLFGLFMLFTGPHGDSVFWFLREPVVFYPISLLCFVFFGFLATIGFKRLRTM